MINLVSCCQIVTVLTDIHFEVKLHGLPTGHDIRDNFCTFSHSKVEHIVVRKVGKEMHEIVEVGKNEFLKSLKLLCLGWWFAINLSLDKSLYMRLDDLQFPVWKSFIWHMVLQNDGCIF
jgi:hypothetical protein